MTQISGNNSNTDTSAKDALVSDVFRLGEDTVMLSYFGGKFLNYICYGASLLLGFSTVSGQYLYDNRGYLNNIGLPDPVWVPVMIQGSSVGDPGGYTDNTQGYVLDISPGQGIIIRMPFQSIDIKVWGWEGNNNTFSMDLVDLSNTYTIGEMFTRDDIRVGYQYEVVRVVSTSTDDYVFRVKDSQGIIKQGILQAGNETGLAALPSISHIISIEDGGGINYVVPTVFTNTGTSANPQWVVSDVAEVSFSESGNSPLYLRIKNTSDYHFTVALQNASLQVPIKTD